MKLASYLRVSTDAQAEHGLGLDVQREAIQGWADRAGHDLVHECSDEGVSGLNGIEDRPALQELLDLLARDVADGVIIHRLDRLARRLETQEAILGAIWKIGKRVFEVGTGEILADDPDDPARTALRQMLGVFSQLDRSNVVARLRAGKRVKRSRGGHAEGPAPYGWKTDGGVLYEIADEQAVLRRIVAMREEDPPRSLRGIARTLTADGVPTRKGGRWSPEHIRQILARTGEKDATPGRRSSRVV